MELDGGSLQAQRDYHQQAPFTDGPPAVNSPLLVQHIEGAVASELDRIGFRRVESGTPDFRVAYHVVTDERSRFLSSGRYYGSFGFGSFYEILEDFPPTTAPSLMAG